MSQIARLFQPRDCSCKICGNAIELCACAVEIDGDFWDAILSCGFGGESSVGNRTTSSCDPISEDGDKPHSSSAA